MTCRNSVQPGKYAPEIIELLPPLQSNIHGPVSYCRTGKRAIHLWPMQGGLNYPIADLSQPTSAAGYEF